MSEDILKMIPDLCSQVRDLEYERRELNQTISFLENLTIELHEKITFLEKRVMELEREEWRKWSDRG